MLYWFQLWREFKLSIAEILSVFWSENIVYSAKGVLIIDGLKKEEVLKNADFLGGTIKIFELSLKKDLEEILEDIKKEALKSEQKFNYSLNIFWEKILDLEKILIKTKRFLQKENISSRFVNKKWENLNSATIIWNNLLKRGWDFNIVDIGWIYYFWKTIWVQDIDSYSKRDFWKQRDMQTWMLPPKLAQIMINLSREKNKKLEKIYDPFVGLWTILIEAKRMWIEKLYWSDLNEKMVETSRKNSSWKIEKLNAKFVNEASFWEEVKDWNIVTEWYLWEIMTQKNISLDRIKKQRESLKKIYEWFFSSLKKWNFSWNIIISFPFWDLKWKYVFFEEIYDILDKYCEILPLFPSEFDFKETKSGSLLYKRSKQLVWREIFKLKIKSE